MRRLLLLLPLAACAATPPAPDPAAWVGRPEGDLVAALGVPSRVYDAEGRRFLAYDAPGAPAPFIMPSIGIGGFRTSGGWGGASGFGTGLGLSFGSLGGAGGPCTTTFEVRQGVVASAGRTGACG